MTTISSKKFTVTSLFAGCGGMDFGFQQSGFDIAWANDINKSACKTYSENLKASICSLDVRNISLKEIPESDVVVGGFPCQGFSIIGTRRLNDERNFLYKSMKQVILEKQPKFFVAENVKGLTNLAGGKILTGILEEFRDIGYTVDWRILNAQDFGVPQHRERVIIIGNRIGSKNSFPSPTHGEECKNRLIQGNLFLHSSHLVRSHLTLRDAIGDLEELGTLANHNVDWTWKNRHPEWLTIMRYISQGQKLCNIRLGKRSVHTWNIPEVYGETSNLEKHILKEIAIHRRYKKYGNKDGNPLSLADISSFVKVDNLSEILDCLLRKEYLILVGDRFELKNSFNGIFRRMAWDKPSEAVLTVFISPRYYIHPSRNRPFSVREVARIQGFPDSFNFFGTLKDQYIQIGNAVPPLLSKKIAECIYNELCKYPIEKTDKAEQEQSFSSLQLEDVAK